jgi:diacylglycerol kinase (ATP)
MTWQIIVNPGAGRGLTSVIDLLRAGVSTRGVPARIHVSTSVEDLRSTVAGAVFDGIGRFVAVGGDGTAHHVVDAALAANAPERRIMLAVIPAGSGSDFIRTFGRTSEGLDEGLDRLVDPTPYGIDVGVLSGSFGTSHFINAANVGVAAASAGFAGRLPKRLGSAKYGVAFWLTLGRFRQAPIEVTAGRHRFSGQAINVVVANGQFFGGGMNVAPRASLVDGTFDIQVFSGPRRNAFAVMPRLLVGGHLTHPAVHRYLGDRLVISCPADWPVEADGESLGSGSVEITILHDAIDIAL